MGVVRQVRFLNLRLMTNDLRFYRQLLVIGRWLRSGRVTNFLASRISMENENQRGR